MCNLACIDQAVSIAKDNRFFFFFFRSRENVIGQIKTGLLLVPDKQPTIISSLNQSVSKRAPLGSNPALTGRLDMR